MKVIFKRDIVADMDSAIYRARNGSNYEIEHIILTKAEAKEFKEAIHQKVGPYGKSPFTKSTTGVRYRGILIKVEG